MPQIVGARRLALLGSDSGGTDLRSAWLHLIYDGESPDVAPADEPEQAANMVNGQLDLLDSILEPVGDNTSQSGLQARAKRVWNRAGDFIRGAQVNSVNTVALARNKLANREAMTNTEKAVAIAAGTLITAGVVYLGLKHGHHAGASSHLADNKAPTQPAKHLQALVPKSTSSLGEHHLSAMNHLHHVTDTTPKPAPKPVILTIQYSGDGIEKEATQYLRQHNYAVSAPNVNRLTAAVMHAQHMSWAQAHFVHVGQHLQAPGRVLKTLSKLKKAKSR